MGRYSLKTYATAPVKLSRLKPVYNPATERRMDSEWADATCGGSTNDPASHERNPKWHLRVEAGVASVPHPTPRTPRSSRCSTVRP